MSIPFGEYLFKRLAQVDKVQSIFGVPGDFNLPLLEHIYKTDLQWVGGCNELNAGYTADGYSRYTNSLGVLITTYGVGELSAINAVAGAFAESSKILHIVGMPSTKVFNSQSEKKKNLHHLVPNINPLQESDHLVYTKMVKDISCISRITLDSRDAVQHLDEVIQEIFTKSKPGYLFLPVDMSELLVDSSKLSTPIAFHKLIDSNPELTESLANLILEKIYNSKNPSLLVDVLTDRFNGATDSVRKLVELTHFHNYTTFMGKSILDESQESFVGDYNGDESNIGIKENIESSDLVLFFGPHINEINTGHYSFDFNEDQLILLHPDYIKIGGDLHSNVNFAHVLELMISKLDVSKCPKSLPLAHQVRFRYPQLPSKTKDLSQSVLLEKFQDFIKPNDVLVCETGSFMFGIPDLRFTKNMKYIAQGFYLSIGAGLPICLGVGIAMKDEDSSSRLILMEGDGSAQMTFQEFSSFAHYDLKPIIFLLNNSGYTVERIIKGETKSYNDIKPWNWLNTFDVFEFGDEKIKTRSKKIANEMELIKSLSGIDRSRLNFFEVILDQMDCPWRFHHMNGYRHFPISRE